VLYDQRVVQFVGNIRVWNARAGSVDIVRDRRTDARTGRDAGSRGGHRTDDGSAGSPQRVAVPGKRGRDHHEDSHQKGSSLFL